MRRPVRIGSESPNAHREMRLLAWPATANYGVHLPTCVTQRKPRTDTRRATGGKRGALGTSMNRRECRRACRSWQYRGQQRPTN